MLRTAQNLRGIITIFHSPKVPASTRLVEFAKAGYKDPAKHQFELQIFEGNPTKDQFATLQKLSPNLATIQTPEQLPRPTLVSWLSGKVAVDDINKAETILKEADANAE